MSGIAGVSPVLDTAAAAFNGFAAPKARPSRPETDLQEAMEPLSETEAEARAGDQQAIRRLSGRTAFAHAPSSDQMAGSIDIKA